MIYVIFISYVLNMKEIQKKLINNIFQIENNE